MDAIERHRWNAPRVVVVQIPSGTARHVGMLVSSTQPTIFGGACLVLVPFDGTQTGHQITVVGMIMIGCRIFPCGDATGCYEMEWYCDQQVTPIPTLTLHYW